MIAQTAHLDQEERERHMNYMRAIASGSQEAPDASESATSRSFEEEEMSKSEVDAEDHPKGHLREAPESRSNSSSKF